MAEKPQQMTITDADGGTVTIMGTPPLPPLAPRDDAPDGPSVFLGLVCGIVLTLLLQWLIKRRVAKALKTAEAPTSHRPSEEVTALRARIATLETIVTDKPGRLSQEIETLR